MKMPMRYSIPTPIPDFGIIQSFIRIPMDPRKKIRHFYEKPSYERWLI